MFIFARKLQYFMTFEILHNDTQCVCVELAQENVDAFFARKIYNPDIRDKDFKSKWEKGHRPDSITDCKRTCGLKGISINIWNDSSSNAFREKLKTTFNFSPKSKDGICVFQFSQDAGLMQYAPSNTDKFHYNFYKSDHFNLNMIKIQEIIPLKN